jgi:hypothetical protein
VVNLIIRRPLNESVERLRDGGVNVCTLDCWKSEEGVSDERLCERSGRPREEEEGVHTDRVHPELGPLLDLDITLAASAVGV